RPWRRLLGAVLRLRSFGIGCFGLRGRVGRTGLAWRGIDGHFGRGALDGRRRALAGTRVKLIAKRLSHYAYRRCSNRGRDPYEDAASESRSARISSSYGRAATIALACSGSTACATAAERQ